VARIGAEQRIEDQPALGGAELGAEDYSVNLRFDGRDAVGIGCGGSIGFVGPLSELFGGAPALLVGIEDPASNAFHKAMPWEDGLLTIGATQALLLAVNGAGNSTWPKYVTRLANFTVRSPSWQPNSIRNRCGPRISPLPRIRTSPPPKTGLPTSDRRIEPG
jgi:hypothetical protein